LIGVTAPAVTQSTVAGNSTSSLKASTSSLSELEGNKQLIYAENSSVVKSAYWFKPTDEVWVGSAFQV